MHFGDLLLPSPFTQGAKNFFMRSPTQGKLPNQIWSKSQYVFFFSIHPIIYWYSGVREYMCNHHEESQVFVQFTVSLAVECVYLFARYGIWCRKFLVLLVFCSFLINSKHFVPLNCTFEQPTTSMPLVSDPINFLRTN